MTLQELRAKQNQIFKDDVDEEDREQSFLYFLGNHPYLFQDFINQGQLTTAEMNYIVMHFHDYTVDPRTFENEFKRELRELLPRYNELKSFELMDEIKSLDIDSTTRHIITDRISQLSENSSRTTDGENTTENGSKQANKNLPMETTGATFEGIVDWSNGGSNIAESKDTGSQTIHNVDINYLNHNGTDNDNTWETTNRKGSIVEQVDKIWHYIVKPKAINWLTSNLSTCYNIIY